MTEQKDLELTPVQVNRLENMRTLIIYSDGPLNLSRRLGYSNGSFIVQMAGPNPRRGITPKQARKIERKLGLPDLILDSEPSEQGVRIALGVDDGAEVVPYSRVSLNRSLNRNASERNRMAESAERLTNTISGRVVAALMRALGGNATPEKVGAAVDRLNEYNEDTGLDVDTKLVENVAKRFANDR